MVDLVQASLRHKYLLKELRKRLPHTCESFVVKDDSAVFEGG